MVTRRFLPCLLRLTGLALLVPAVAAPVRGVDRAGPPGPSPDGEQKALAAERDMSARHGESLLRLCEEVGG